MQNQTDKEYILELIRENKELKDRCEQLMERLRVSEYERFYGKNNVTLKASLQEMGTW